MTSVKWIRQPQCNKKAAGTWQDGTTGNNTRNKKQKVCPKEPGSSAQSE